MSNKKTNNSKHAKKPKKSWKVPIQNVTDKAKVQLLQIAENYIFLVFCRLWISIHSFSFRPYKFIQQGAVLWWGWWWQQILPWLLNYRIRFCLLYRTTRHDTLPLKRSMNGKGGNEFSQVFPSLRITLQIHSYFHCAIFYILASVINSS